MLRRTCLNIIGEIFKGPNKAERWKITMIFKHTWSEIIRRWDNTEESEFEDMAVENHNETHNKEKRLKKYICRESVRCRKISRNRTYLLLEFSKGKGT